MKENGFVLKDILKEENIVEIMRIGMADRISNMIEEAISKKQINFEVNRMDYTSGKFKEFSHQWIDNKDIRGAFKIVKGDRTYFSFSSIGI